MTNIKSQGQNSRTKLLFHFTNLAFIYQATQEKERMKKELFIVGVTIDAEVALTGSWGEGHGQGINVTDLLSA